MAHAFACRWLDRWIERRPDAIWGLVLEALCHELYSNLGFEDLLLSTISLKPHVDEGHLPPIWTEVISFAHEVQLVHEVLGGRHGDFLFLQGCPGAACVCQACT